MMVPKYIFLTRGIGISKEKLSSFEAALRCAEIAKYNLVRVSSIFPPHCVLLKRDQGLLKIRDGQILHVVMSDNATNEPNRLLSASIGIARPKDHEHYGYLSEHHSFGMIAPKAGEYAEDLAAQMLASSMGVSFDPDKSYNQRKEEWKISGKFYKTSNITQSALGNKDGLWTTVLVAAVMVV